MQFTDVCHLSSFKVGGLLNIRPTATLTEKLWKFCLFDFPCWCPTLSWHRVRIRLSISIIVSRLSGLMGDVSFYTIHVRTCVAKTVLLSVWSLVSWEQKWDEVYYVKWIQERLSRWVSEVSFTITKRKFLHLFHLHDFVLPFSSLPSLTSYFLLSCFSWHLSTCSCSLGFNVCGPHIIYGLLDFHWLILMLIGI